MSIETAAIVAVIRLIDVADKTDTKTAPLEELMNQFTQMLIYGFAAR